MARVKAYRRLCAGLGGLLVLGGLVLFASFFGYHAPGSQPRIETGPVGYYFVGFAGSALVAWGGCLLGTARRADPARSIGTWSAIALVMMAVMRSTAWVVGDYHVWPGELLRIEAVLLLVAALGFLWLRPPAAERSR